MRGTLEPERIKFKPIAVPGHDDAALQLSSVERVLDDERHAKFISNGRKSI